MKIMALLSVQSTACVETALIDGEDTPENRAGIERMHCTGHRDAPLPGTWTNCSEDEALWPEGEK